MQMTGNLSRIRAELANQATQIRRNQNSSVLMLSNLPFFSRFSLVQAGFKKLLLMKEKNIGSLF